MGGILRRCRNVKGNLSDVQKLAGYLGINFQLRTEINEKDGLPLGNEPESPTEAFDGLDVLVPAGHAGR